MAAQKPHAVFIPFPFQSHIKSTMKLAKLLYHKGFHITFVNTEFNHKRLLESRGPDSLNGLLHFRFETIPDGLPPEIDASQVTPSISESVKNNFLAPFSNLLDKLNDKVTSNVPPVTCIVSDLMPFTITAAEERGIPIALFAMSSASSFMGFRHLRALKEKGLSPLKDESCLTNGFLDKVIDWIPGMKGIRVRDIPRFASWMDPSDSMINYLMEIAEIAYKASALIFHSFDALEQEVLNALSSMYSCLYAIGPLQLHLNRIQDDHDLNSIGYNLCKEDPECLQWLDSKKPNSVVYVNFGSLLVMKKEELIEFGMGLAKSGYPFLWIIRPDMVTGDSAMLPPKFTEETKDKSFICSWCPQEEVLNHPSITGFLTHSGWGSTMESISAGVPMLCWPSISDQQTNCRYTCNEWGIGMEIDNNVNRQNVEKLVRELMEGENEEQSHGVEMEIDNNVNRQNVEKLVRELMEGKKMKSKAMEWKKLAEEAAAPNGLSSMNLDKLINEVLLS